MLDQGGCSHEAHLVRPQIAKGSHTDGIGESQTLQIEPDASAISGAVAARLDEDLDARLV